MSDSQITLQQRTENFAIRVIKAYCQLNKRNFDDAGKILANTARLSSKTLKIGQFRI